MDWAEKYMNLLGKISKQAASCTYNADTPAGEKASGPDLLRIMAQHLNNIVHEELTGQAGGGRGIAQ